MTTPDAGRCDPGARPPLTRPPLTRTRIVAAAVAMADEAGLALLSMRALGQALGVQGMALYNHVADKDDLLDAMVDAVVGEIHVPRIEGPWQHEMRRRCVSAREVLLRHPWAGPAIMTRVVLGPAMLRYVDATIGCLRAGGFSIDGADRAWNLLDTNVYGFTLQEVSAPIGTDLPDVVRTALVAAAPTHPHLAEMGAYVTSLRGAPRHDFVVGLDLVLDALERQL